MEISSFHRSLTPKELRHNLISLRNLLRSPGEARALLKEFPASLVVGTGGYASYPMVRAAAKRGIPAAIHESNAIPGLTTRLLEGHADLIMVGFEECRKNYKHPEKVLVTGTPVRGDFFRLTKAEAKKRLGVDDGKPLIVSFWGSQGAAEMNRQTARFLALEAREVPFHHVHAAGKLDSVHMAEYLKGAGVIPLRADLVDRDAALKHSRELSPTCKWEISREILGGVSMLREQADGIILLSAFPCGPDAMVNELIARRVKDVPILNLVVDSQTGTAGVETRLESFIDIIRFQRGEL